VTQIQEAMQEQGVDVVVLRLAENVLLATEWFVRASGSALVMVPASGVASLIVPIGGAEDATAGWSGSLVAYEEKDSESLDAALGRTLRDLSSELEADGGRVGIEGSFELIAPSSFAGESSAVCAPTLELVREAFRARELVDFTETLEAIRSVKTERELDLIQRTNEIAAFGFEAFKQAAVPGATEVEVMAATEQAIAVHGHGHRGARWVRGFATVGSGPALVDGWQYFRASTRRIERGDVVMLELGTVADGYWSDHTRTVVAGRATPTLRGAYLAVRAAGAAALAAARPGATGGEVDAAARAACAAAGFAQHRHHTGHGTGFRYHESRPAIQTGSDHVLEAGQVIVAEPGVYGPPLNTGVRHEDDAVVTADGAVILAGADFELEL
jgi:Xaa-Pro aminopeptidase